MKIEDYQAGRADGMVFAHQIAKTEGVQALEDELKFRKATGINTIMSKKELNKACQKIKEMTCDTIQCLTLAVLHDEFGFGKKRCEQFLRRFNLKTESMMDDMSSWNDYVAMIKDELDIDLGMRWNE